MAESLVPKAVDLLIDGLLIAIGLAGATADYASIGASPAALAAILGFGVAALLYLARF